MDRVESSSEEMIVQTFTVNGKECRVVTPVTWEELTDTQQEEVAEIAISFFQARRIL